MKITATAGSMSEFFTIYLNLVDPCTRVDSSLVSILLENDTVTYVLGSEAIIKNFYIYDLVANPNTKFDCGPILSEFLNNDATELDPSLFSAKSTSQSSSSFTVV